MKQSQALTLLKAGHHVFLTGQAGAGKTYVLNQYIQHLREHGIAVAITASTGIAATHMNGMTIHAWSGIGIKDSFDGGDYRRLAKNEALVERLQAVSVLIIDEVSMLHARQLDLVDNVLRHFRKDNRPFGGVQVVLSGDFFQLPPIGDKDESTKDKFAFMSKAWIALANDKIDDSPAIKICYLSEQHRQNHDDDGFVLSLNDILNQIRNQTITHLAIDTLNATRHHALDICRTRLYTHNAKVDEINQNELAALDGKIYEYPSISLGDEKLIETLKKQVRTYETLSLKKGAKVMFIKNNLQEEFYNGTLGEVIEFVPIDEDGKVTHYPKVRLNNGRKIVATYDVWSIDDEEGKPLASFSQLPLCLAWAITVHKSQGMTLDAAEIDLSKTFEKGQGYVALSRVKSLQGLRLLGLNDKSLLLDDFAQVANRRFLVLSAECERWLDKMGDKLEQDTQAFIKKHAILYPIKDLLKTSPKPKTAIKDESSSDKTLALLKLGKGIDDIADERKLAKSTIIGHIEELLKTKRANFELIAHIMPDDGVVFLVKTAVERLQANGELTDGIRLNPIYDELRGGVSYHTIRLALLFLDIDDNLADS